MSIVPFVHLDTPLDGRVAGDEVPLAAEDVHHLRRVLRLRPGAQVELTDGDGRVVLAALTEDAARLRGAPVEIPPAQPQVAVAQALAKGRKLDDVVRVVTELGVDEVVPVVAERSVVRLDAQKQDRAQQRWTAVARAASEQARRSRRPRIAAPQSPADLLARPGQVIVAHPDVGLPSLPRVLAGHDGRTPVTLAVGPEGGWSEREVAAFVAGGGLLAGLGNTVLRTEHAAAAAVAVCLAALGRWDTDGGRQIS